LIRNARFSLRITIAGLVVGLLLLTVTGVLVVALTIRSRTIAATAETLQREISTRITEKVLERFGPLPGILRECRASAERGLLPVDDAETLAARLAARIRHDLRLEWLAFVRTDGGATGAVRLPDGTIQMILKEPGTKGRVVVETWREDGSRERDDQSKMNLSSIQRVAWYELGARSDEPRWTPAYVRPLDGTLGRACALSFRRAGALVGVFGLGFGVEFLREYVREVKVGTSGRVFTVHPTRGEIMVAPSAEDLQRMGPAVAGALAALPGGVTALEPGKLHATSFTHGGVAYRVGVELQHPEGLPPWVHAIVIPEDELVGYFRGYLPIGLGATGALLLVAILLAHLLARRVARPLRTIAGDLERVGDFELSERQAPRSLIHEVAVVGDSVDRMKASLRSFGRYVPTDLVRDLLHQGAEARLGGVERPLTLFFSDVQGFTGLSEGVAPTALVDALGDYLEVVTQVVKAWRGTIDKFIGDGVLAFFNAPHDDPDHAAHGCQAALDLQACLAEEIPRWEEAGRPPFWTRVGLHTDRVVVGNIGTPERFAYTVIGDGVNLAARLESLNKVYGTWILASDSVREAAGEGFVWRRVDRTSVAGRTTSGDVFELIGTVATVDSARFEARDAYESALEAYFARRFEEAERGFSKAARLRPGDRAAEVLRSRAQSYVQAPPPADWNGVFVQTRK